MTARLAACVAAVALLATGSDSTVNEADLLYRAAVSASADIATLVADIMTDPACGPVTDAPDIDWDSRTVGHPVRCADDRSYEPSSNLYAHVTFGDAVYPDGRVDTGHCRTLPGGGTKTSGEYNDVANGSSDVVTQHLVHSVEETSSHETSLDVDVALDTGTTVEGGVSFGGGDAKATQSFQQHFGVKHGSVASSATTTKREVSLDISIRPGQRLGVAYTLDNLVQDCARSIDSTIDWESIDVAVYRHRCNQHADGWRDPCSGPNDAQLRAHYPDYEHGHFVGFRFSGLGDLFELVDGHSTLCDRCRFTLSPGHGRLVNDRLRNPLDSYRSITLDATERSTVKDSASYTIADVTGLDRDCVADVLGTAGHDADSLDDRLASC